MEIFKGKEVDVVAVPGTPNGIFPLEGQGGRPGKLYCPVDHTLNVLRAHHGRIDVDYLNWATIPHLPREGFLGANARSVPLYALPAMFESYQTDTRMKGYILEELKRKIIASRGKGNDLYLIGHSLGAAIICEALEELVREKRIQKREEQNLRLILLAPAVGPLMGGRIAATLGTEDLDTVLTITDRVLEMRVDGDLLSVNSGWAAGALATGQVTYTTLRPPFGRWGKILGLGTPGHTLVDRCGEGALRGWLRTMPAI